MSPSSKRVNDNFECDYHECDYHEYDYHCQNEATYFYYMNDEISTELVFRCHDHKWLVEFISGGWKILSKEEALCATVLHI